MFEILTEKLEPAVGASCGAADRAAALGQAATAAAPLARDGGVCLEGKRGRRPRGARVKQLEIENLHLKQLIGNLSLEKKLLLERLAAIEPKRMRGES